MVEPGSAVPVDGRGQRQCRALDMVFMAGFLFAPQADGPAMDAL
jgi:hypothetical protein